MQVYCNQVPPAASKSLVTFTVSLKLSYGVDGVHHSASLVFSTSTFLTPLSLAITSPLLLPHSSLKNGVCAVPLRHQQNKSGLWLQTWSRRTPTR